MYANFPFISVAAICYHSQLVIVLRVRSSWDAGLVIFSPGSTQQLEKVGEGGDVWSEGSEFFYCNRFCG